MIPTRQMALAAFLIWMAAVLQGRVAHAVAFRGAEPDLPLVFLCSSAILVGSLRGSVLGFLGGTAGIGVVSGSLWQPFCEPDFRRGTCRKSRQQSHPGQPVRAAAGDACRKPAG